MNNLWWKAAAILIIIVTGVAIIIFTADKNRVDRDEIVKTENKVNEDDGKVTEQANAITPKTADTENLKQVQPSNAAEKKVTRQKEKPPASTEAENPVLFNKSETKEVTKDEEEVQDNVAAPKKAPAAAAAADTFPAQVERPVAGAESAQSKEPDSMFDEVIVVGTNNGESSKMKSKTVIARRFEKRVMPENGWDEFQQYIEDSTKITTADSVFTGEEHVAFTIGDDGLPESIHILRSISPSHDKEAIRLLENGPTWKVTKGARREIRLKLIF